MDTFGHFFLSDQRTKETDKQEFNVTVMADLIGHLADYQMPGRGRA